MQEITLKASKRDVTGRKVKVLRAQGLVPANVYGKKTKSLSVSLNKDEFGKIFAQAGETGVVTLQVEKETEKRPILIQNVQIDPVSDKILHVDLRQIILTEKVTAKIPVELTGEALASKEKIGILIQTLSEIEVEALPMDLPEKFVADVSKLEKVGDAILVKDLDINRGKLEIKIEEDSVVAKIDPLAAEEVAPAPAVEEAPAEGEAKAEGEQPKAAEEQPSKEEKTEEAK